MAKLFKCKGCGNQISKKSQSCPKCGEPNIRTHWFTWLVLILFIFFLKSILSSPEKSYTQQKKIITNEQIKSKKNIYYVISNKLNVRLGANKTSLITNILYKGQKLKVFEIKNGWARISHYYDGKVEGTSGNIARWVFTKYLSIRCPPKKKINITSSIINVLKSSDDFEKHQKVFISASENLIYSGRCTLKDFKNMGGWLKSNNDHRYFTYCGKLRIENKIYLNTLTGSIVN
jgi:hypothetical protein